MNRLPASPCESAPAFVPEFPAASASGFSIAERSRPDSGLGASVYRPQRSLGIRAYALQQTGCRGHGLETANHESAPQGPRHGDVARSVTRLGSPIGRSVLDLAPNAIATPHGSSPSAQVET